MPHMKKALALLAAFVLHFVGAGAVMAEQPESPPPGMAKYLVVLWEPGTPVPGEKGKTASGKDPEFGKMGGRVLFSRGNRRVIYLPRGEAKGLRRHESVSYVQRIWAGEPLTDWVDEEPDSHSRFEAETDATNLTWGPVDYGYDSAGNIKSAGQDRYTYDSAGRLIEALVGGRTESYEYDSFGNMTKKGLNGVTPTTMQVDGTSNRLTGPEYDVAGNLLSTADREYYTYDSLGMMVTSDRGSSSLRYIYDANEERVGRLTDTLISRWTVRDLEGRVLREFKSDDTGEGSYWYWEQDYVYADGLLVGGETQKWGAPQYGGRRHYHLDHLGSIRMVTNETRHALARRDYYPFGVEQTASWQEQLDSGAPHVDDARFTGHERDFHSSAGIENNDYLDYMHARYYDPNKSRFLSVDAGPYDITSPQTWNRYSYVTNNPMNLSDPTGLCGEPPDFVGPTQPCDIGYAMEVEVAAEEPSMMEHVLWYAEETTAELTPWGPMPFMPDDPDVMWAMYEAEQNPPEGQILTGAPMIGPIRPTGPYVRPSGATTPQQRAAVQGRACAVCGATDGKRIAGHNEALVQEYYRTGTIDKTRMRDLNSVRPECVTCSAREGSVMSRFSRYMKNLFGF
jgi:RHS repeat-associated protein